MNGSGSDPKGEDAYFSPAPIFPSTFTVVSYASGSTTESPGYGTCSIPNIGTTWSLTPAISRNNWECLNYIYRNASTCRNTEKDVHFCRLVTGNYRMQFRRL